MEIKDCEEFIRASTKSSLSENKISVFQVYEAAQVALAAASISIRGSSPKDVGDEDLAAAIKKSLAMAIDSIS